jgi:hypothetical protein
MTQWTEFLKAHKGKGLTMDQLSKRYCNSLVSEKIRKNVKEYPQKQAIAVSYSQVKKAHKGCGF